MSETYQGRTIADINGNPPEQFPQMRLGVLAGRRWPPKLRPAHLFKSAELIMAGVGGGRDRPEAVFNGRPRVAVGFAHRVEQPG